MAMQLYISDSNQPYNLTSLLSPGKNCVRIFKASSRGTDKALAIKVFQRKKGEDPNPHYSQEHKIASKISHPYILSYHEFHTDAKFKQFKGPFNDCSAIVMEYLPYGDLFALIQKKSCSEKLARTFFHQMVSAIEYLHDKESIAHLDIKPENFLIHPNGLKLIDFDFSHKMDASLNDGMKGTPGYRPPELVKGQLKNLKSADIYSLGVVLFTIIVGWAPYEEIEEQKDTFKFDKYYEVLRSDPSLFWQTHENYLKEDPLHSGLTLDLKELVESLMHEDPDRRPTVSKIKEHKWFNGEVFESEDLENHLKTHYFSG